MKPLLLALLGWLLSIQGAHAEDFLPPEQAFKVTIAVPKPDCEQACVADVRIEVADGYYLYLERFKTEALSGLQGLTLQNMPKGKRKFDENLGQEIEALRGQLQFQLAYEPIRPLGPLAGNLISQGCADAGLCYPPMTTAVPFAKVSVPSKGLAGGDSRGNAAPVASAGADEAGSLAARLAGQSWFVVMPVFFGLGLLLAFTPCTLPMLPIVTSLVVGQSGKAKGFILALMYVLGMSLTYSVLGVLAGISGQSLVVALQQAAVLWSFGLLLGALGVALLLGYSLQVPASMQAWIQEKTGGLKGGEYLPVMIMGVLSALLLGPCVAPPLAGALLYIGQTGQAAMGGAALFSLALGMGLPMVLIAGGAGTLLPRAGYWMNWVSGVFGFALLGTAIWIVTPATPVQGTLVLWTVWAALVAGACFQGVASAQLKSAVANALFRAVGVLAAVVALVYGMALASGGQALLQPLAHLKGGGGAVQAHGPQFESVASGDLLKQLQVSTQPVFLDFYADWCVSCKEFEAFTLTDAQVQAGLKGLRLVRVDVTRNTAEDQALMKHFGLFGPPALLFFKVGGEELKANRVVGFQNAERFNTTLNQVRPLLGL